METNKNIMPIIGLEKAIFGYIIEGGGYNGPSYRFVFCDEKGTETEFEIKDFLILSVYQHYYSANVSLETQNVIIIDSQNNIITIGGYHFKKKYIQEITPIGDNGLAICAPTTTKEDKFGTKPHFFHPVSYLNLKDSPHIIDLKERIFWKQKYYLFSIMNMHFIVDIENTKFEAPDDFTYRLIDEYGNTIYKWNKDNQIKCVWRREDGSFTIFSVSYCYDYMHQEYCYDKPYRELTLININNNYNNITYEEYKKEREELIESNVEGEIHSYDEIKKDEFFKWKRIEYINEKTILIKADLLKSLDCRYKSDRDSFDICYSGLFCDNCYFIEEHSCGFCSFDENKLLAINDFSSFIPIDNYNYNDSEYKPSISNCKYSNGLVGLQLMKCYIGDYPQEEEKKDYDKNIGNYRLYDIYGNCIGELNDDVLRTPVNGVGITQYYGVIKETDFSFIIPPIFKEIIPLNRYILQVEIGKGANKKDKTGDDILGSENFLYEYDFLWTRYRVIEDKKIYIVTQEIEYDGRIQRGLFEGGTELVTLGNYDIKKVSGQYVLVKESSQSLYKLYFHNGKILFEGVKDATVVNIYNDMKALWKSYVIHNELVPKLHFCRINMEKGFWVMVEDKLLIDKLLLEMIPVLFTNDDAIYYASLLNGDIILLSIRKGIIASNLNGAELLFNIGQNILSPERDYSTFSHIIKYGDALTENLRENISKHVSVDGVLYVEGVEDSEQVFLAFQIETNDKKCGYYSIKKGWIVKPEDVKIRDIFDNYLIFNQYIIDSRGNLTQYNSILKPVNKIGQISAYYDSSKDKYIIIDSNGFIYSYLQEIEPDILISNELDSCHEYQIILNVATKKLQVKPNPKYRAESSYCPAPNEWTDEDAWDVMTEGDSGDYPGPGWDMERFGY